MFWPGHDSFRTSGASMFEMRDCKWLAANTRLLLHEYLVDRPDSICDGTVWTVEIRPFYPDSATFA